MRIGELADRLNINTKTVRYYESIGLLREPDRTSSGYRVYDNTDAELITFVKTAQRLGMSLDEIQEILAYRDRGEPPCDFVRQSLREQVTGLDQRIAELVGLRDQLFELDRKTADLPPDDGCYCSIIEHADPQPK